MRIRARVLSTYAAIVLIGLLGVFVTACTHLPVRRKGAADVPAAAEPPSFWSFDAGG
jgi:hypothetical protein